MKSLLKDIRHKKFVKWVKSDKTQRWLIGKAQNKMEGWSDNEPSPPYCECGGELYGVVIKSITFVKCRKCTLNIQID